VKAHVITMFAFRFISNCQTAVFYILFNEHIVFLYRMMLSTCGVHATFRRLCNVVGRTLGQKHYFLSVIVQTASIKFQVQLCQCMQAMGL